jgi:energy-converting hydrogenase Eha subunit B
MSSTTVTTRTTPAVSTAQKVGLVLCALYSLSNIPSFLFPSDSGDDAGPPLSILVVDTLLGVVGLVAAILAWRGNRVALRIAAGAIIVITLTGLPAFFVDVPMAIKALVGLGVVLTVVTVVLMFSGPRRPASIDD